jgi:DHA2 family multidrug resistance protein-like MFS transporter
MSMTPREQASALAVLSSMALVVLDAGLLNVALPTIAQSLGETPGRAILAVIAYQAALLVGLLPCAHVAEKLGYRRLFVGGLALFSAASILCAFAPSLPILLAARLVQGLGGAAILSLGIALLRFALGPDRLGAAIGWNALTVALCSAAGPIVGAFILSVAPWSWLFLAKLPIATIALVAAAALPEVKLPGPPIDVPGLGLHGSIAALILIAAGSAPIRSLAALVPAGAAVVLAMLLIRRMRSLPAPVWPIDLLSLRPVRVSAAASICCFAGQSAGLLALPFYLQPGLGQSPLAAGLVLACLPLAAGATGPLANCLAHRFGSAFLCTAGAAVLSAGLLLCALWPAVDGFTALALGAALAGLGFGLFQVPNNRILFLTVPAGRSAAAGGLQGSARLVGQTFGALLMGLLFSWASTLVAARAGLALASLFAAAASLVSALELPARARRVEPRAPSTEPAPSPRD